VAGGIAPKNLSHIATGDEGLFLKSLRDKGRLSPAVRCVPVYVVLDEALGQRGAHFIAHKLLRRQGLARQQQQQQQEDGQGQGQEQEGRQAAAAASVSGGGAGGAAPSAASRCPISGAPCGPASGAGAEKTKCCPVPGWLLPFAAGVAVAVLALHSARRLK